MLLSAVNGSLASVARYNHLRQTISGFVLTFLVTYETGARSPADRRRGPGRGDAGNLGFAVAVGGTDFYVDKEREQGYQGDCVDVIHRVASGIFPCGQSIRQGAGLEARPRPSAKC